MESLFQPAPRRGFTLIELLVVIAVIAILAAVLLPVLSRSQMTAQGARCMNDHKQLAVAWTLYCGDNSEQIPVLEDWVAGDMSDPFDCTNIALLLDPQQSALARYVTLPGIYKCPADLTRFVRSVSMNNRMNPTLPGLWLHGSGDAYQIFSKVQEIRTPSDIYLTTDERSDTINDGSLCVDMSNTGDASGIGTSDPYWMADFPAGYHNRCGRFSFADGHAESHKWQEPYILMPLGQAHLMHTSSTDLDAQWIQNHCTVAK